MQGNLLHCLHLLFQTFLLSIISFGITRLLIVILLLLVLLLVPAPGDGEDDHVPDEREQKAKGDHPWLKEPDSHKKSNEDPGGFQFVLPVENTPEVVDVLVFRIMTLPGY